MSKQTYHPTPIGSVEDQTRIERTRAQEALERARGLHRTKRYELRIDERTTILVEKKNHHRAYAEAYRKKMNKQ